MNFDEIKEKLKFVNFYARGVLDLIDSKKYGRFIYVELCCR